MPVVDVSSLFKDMSQAESKLFNKARDLFFVNERKQTKAAHSAELTNLLFELLDRELSPATVAEVTSMLVNTVQKLKDYAVTKKTLGILLVRNDISKPALANVYALAAESAVENKDPEISPQRIEIYFKLAEQYGRTAISAKLLHFLMDHHYVESHEVQAVAYGEKLLLTNNIHYKISALYVLGKIHLDSLNNYTKAQQVYEELAAIYEANPAAFSEYERDLIGTSLNSFACLLNDDYGEIISDPDKAVYYFKLAAKLDNYQSLRTLAYKYHYGEDVISDEKKGIRYLRRAFEKSKSLDDLLDLINILKTNELDYQNEISRLKKIDIKQYYHHQGHYTLQQYITQANKLKNIADARTSSELKKIAATAFKLLSQTLKEGLNNPQTQYSLGLMHHLGIGTQQDFKLAEMHYDKAGKLGYSKYADVIKQLRKDIAAGNTADSFATFITGKPVEKPAAETKEAKESEEIKATEKNPLQAIQPDIDLRTILQNDKISSQEKISLILAHEAKTLTPLNLVIMINRLGVVTERSLTNRDFHNAQIPKIHELLLAIDNQVPASAFTAPQIVLMIEGMSKLYLQTEVIGLGELILKMYQAVMNDVKALDIKMLTSLIYSTTRLDSQNTVLPTIMPQLFELVIARENELDLHDFSKLIYATAVLDNSTELVKLADIKKLVNNIVTISQDKGNPQIKRQLQDPELIFVRQLYMASYYFYQEYPQLHTKQLEQALQFWKESLGEAKAKTNESLLQKEITHFFAQYFTEHEKEFLVNTLPVDAYFRVDEKKGFILQVDGPSHFLHANDGAPKPTQKLAFRNKYLRYEQPLVSVSYYDWKHIKTPHEREIFITDLLKEINIPLGQKWLPATGKSSPRLFNVGRSSVAHTPKPANKSRHKAHK